MPPGLGARWLLLPLALMSLATASELLPNVTGDVTLTTAGSPWVVNETVYVEETGSLTVQPGVTVLMASGASLMVYGQLIAEGTSTDRIQFTLLDTRNTAEGKLKPVISESSMFCLYHKDSSHCLSLLQPDTLAI